MLKYTYVSPQIAYEQDVIVGKGKFGNSQISSFPEDKCQNDSCVDGSALVNNSANSIGLQLNTESR